MAASIGFDVFARDHASNTFDKVGRSVDRTGNKMRILGKIGRTAAYGFGAALGLAGGAAFKFAKAAAEDEVGATGMARQFKASAGATDKQIAATERWITKMGVARGVADDDLRPALSKLVVATGSVSKAQKLTNLAMNVSAGTHKDLATVSAALAKAQNGNVGGLGRLGIATKDAAGKTKTFAAIQQDLSKQFRGAAAQAADTTAGKFQRLKVMASEAGESLGYKLLPLGIKVADWLRTKAIPGIEGLVKKFQAGTGPMGAFRTILGKVGGIAQNVGNWIKTDLLPFITDLRDRFSDAMGGTSGFKDSLNDMKPFLTFVGDALKVLWNGLKMGAKVYVPLMVTEFKIFAKALGLVGRAYTGLWNNAAQPVMKLIVSGLGHAMSMWGAMLSALSHVPGFGWAKAAGDKLSAAGDAAQNLANKINKIPSNKPVKIKPDLGSTAAIENRLNTLTKDRTTHINAVFGGYTGKHPKKNTTSGGNPLPGATLPRTSGRSADPMDLGRSIPASAKAGAKKANAWLSAAGASLMTSLVAGVTKKKVKFKDALDAVTSYATDMASKLSDIVAQRDDFANSFTGFQSSIFADDNGDLPPTLASILSSQQSKQTSAQSLLSDVAKVTSLGLSNDLIKQFQASGATGTSTLHALAQQANSQAIAQLNAMDAQTTALLQQAGQTAAAPIYTTPINQAQADSSLANAIVLAMQGAGLGGGDNVFIQLDGQTIQASITKSKKKRGKK